LSRWCRGREESRCRQAERERVERRERPAYYIIIKEDILTSFHFIIIISSSADREAEAERGICHCRARH